eukprot:gnl/TRDRNA2_/TRDRNA2_158806_c0_seq2.p1 gnl/TRDRNA2_/TRDRNA2_158806_c0~~gnl/TRDRNA2_/TRDRNA2_158806_c0_seq2.p1  ORF type:complete len:197 (-),score=26.23 gnl/TRDRNA2_/TRDRNA2_158806_c0_seq2:320-835(-)
MVHDRYYNEIVRLCEENEAQFAPTLKKRLDRAKVKGMRDYGFEVEDVPDDDGRFPGELTKWSTDKGYGFVRPEDGSDEIFLPSGHLADGVSVKQGNKVTFVKSINEQSGRAYATNVKPVLLMESAGALKPNIGIFNAVLIGLILGAVTTSSALCLRRRISKSTWTSESFLA